MNKYLLVFLTFFLILTSSCEPLYKRKLNKSIASSQEILLNDDLGMNDSVATSLLKEYQKFVEHYPQDEKAAIYLYKAGDLANGMGLSTLAIDSYQKLYDSYPAFEERAMCLFIMGFIYEENLGNYKKAEEMYRLFLEEYPDHELSKDVQMSLQNLGKSPEELIKEFEQNLRESGEDV